MAPTSCIDLDAILYAWGERRMPDGYALTSLDTSQVRVSQMSVAYRGGADWYRTRATTEAALRGDDEVFSNDDGHATTWRYEQTVDFPAHAEWDILKGYQSNTLSPKLLLEFPACAEGRRPIHVIFSSASPATQCADANDKFVVERDIHVRPYASAHAHIIVRTCRLENVLFTNDVHLSGTVTAYGERTRKNAGATAHKVTAGIEEALKGHPSFFGVVDATCGEDGDYRIAGDPEKKKMAFRVEGVCSGEVAVTVDVDVTDMETQV